MGFVDTGVVLVIFNGMFVGVLEVGWLGVVLGLELTGCGVYRYVYWL